MHGGAVTLARQFLKGAFEPDLIVATDMLDLSVFLALTRHRTAPVRTVLYFHENQISYPWSKADPDPARDRDAHYGFINLTSALAADLVVFNSEYHRASFLSDLKPFLKAFPDYNEAEAVEAISAKSHVLYLGLDLARFDRFRVDRESGQPALVVWNHRWEYDKNPDDFFRALFLLKEEGLDFRVAVLGEAYKARPPVFEEAKERLADRIVQFGYAEDFAAYAAWLWRADISPVTSIHDFFGASVVQAMYCNCFPLLPRRLVYPEHVRTGEDRVTQPGGQEPPAHGDDFFYSDFPEMVGKLRHRIANPEQTRAVRTQSFVRRYDWGNMVLEYDDFFDKLIAEGGLLPSAPHRLPAPIRQRPPEPLERTEPEPPQP
jgi:glycosyltransferase involved in cell wall biosynthesis